MTGAIRTARGSIRGSIRLADAHGAQPNLQQGYILSETVQFCAHIVQVFRVASVVHCRRAQPFWAIMTRQTREAPRLTGF